MIIFTAIVTIIGFMIAIQFQTTKEPEIRDTRNIAQLRHDLTVEKVKQQELNKEIEKHAELLNQLQQTENIEEVMLEVIEELKAKAGLTEISDQGVIIEINPFFDEYYFDAPIRSVPSYLLRMLINELNINGAKEISVDNQRIISTTPIREVNGVTLVNGKRITQFPLTIKVLTDDPERLHHAIMSSQSREFFSYENLLMESKPINYVTLPAYDKAVRVKYMNIIKEDK